MPSPASLNYFIAAEKARILRQTATDSRLRPMSHEQIQIYYHASLAAFVAAWDAYLNELVRNFYDTTADPLNPKFHAVHSVAKAMAERALEKFNTPNWDNTRNLLIQQTGYDPISDWVWKLRKMNSVAVRLRLNEILKVRHSFAHGFSLPPYSWTQSPTGKIRLTAQAIKDVEAFFLFLVKATDDGMKRHIQTNYGISILW